MPISTKVLVVGTTPDYIDWIRSSDPDRALFLTDPAARRQAVEPSPPPAEEVLCNLSDYSEVRQALQRHLLHENIRLDGVACYDCESMELAALLAQEYLLPYPSGQAVNNCRNKYLTKTLWARHNLVTPQVRQIRSATEAVHFFQELGSPCVLKPLGGSGSELIFRCDSERACRDNFIKIISGLQQRRNNRLYMSFRTADPVILAEEFVMGEEFSCDFAIENGRVEVIRLTRKILSSRGPFGTALGYLLPGPLPEEIKESDFRQTLYQSALALGINRGICMLDFMVCKNRIVLLELSPRPGGDCLPYLLRRCWNLDMITLYLDFCQQRPWRLQKPANLNPCLG
ncbi:MAG: ATP-grasp domain-containing protein, partial [Desulfobacteraceae bacterium]|nr:ATP-grasp domain-containing protein [Desulfobacteraceae bacterium]